MRRCGSLLIAGLVLLTTCAAVGQSSAPTGSAAQDKLSQAYDALSADKLGDVVALAKDVLSTAGDDVSVRMEAEALLVESIYGVQGHDAAVNEIQILRASAKGGDAEVALLDLLLDRMKLLDDIRKQSADRLSGYDGKADASGKDSLLELAGKVVLYGTSQEGISALERAAGVCGPSTTALKAIAIKSLLFGSGVAASDTGSDIKSQTQLDEATDAYSDGRYGDVAGICESLLSSTDTSV